MWKLHVLKDEKVPSTKISAAYCTWFGHEPGGNDDARQVAVDSLQVPVDARQVARN